MNVIVNEALSSLQKGGTMLYPTETVWGLGCDATNEAAVNKVMQIKKRPNEKSFIILLANAKQIFQYVANPHPDIVSIVKNFQKPTTVVYPQAVNLPDNVINQDGSIAIRITQHPFCKMLIKRLKAPLISTSANYSGEPTPILLEDVNLEICNQVDYIARIPNSEHQGTKTPSQIVKIEDNGSITIIRA